MNADHVLAALPAHFAVWLVSPEAAFLRGKFVWTQWDVEQLKARAKEIEDSSILTSNILGWPWAPASVAPSSAKASGSITERFGAAVDQGSEKVVLAAA